LLGRLRRVRNLRSAGDDHFLRPSYEHKGKCGSGHLLRHATGGPGLRRPLLGLTLATQQVDAKQVPHFDRRLGKADPEGVPDGDDLVRSLIVIDASYRIGHGIARSP
jgi:hypothetical protein